MSVAEILILVALLAIAAMLAFVILRLVQLGTPAPINEKLEALDLRLSDNLAFVKLAVDGLREDSTRSAHSLREEIATRMDSLGTGLLGTLTTLGKQHSDRFDAFARQLEQFRASADVQGKASREELVGSFEKLATSLSGRMGDQAAEQTRRFDSFGTQLTEHRGATAEAAKALRDEVTTSLAGLGLKVAENLETVGQKQAEALGVATNAIKELAGNNERRQDALRLTVEGRLDSLRTENAEKLEQMRVTVDEKLQGTLDARLGASFTQVNENLERVFKSVGEMQALATGVGDLKRVLSNIKSRGTWGEGNLGLLLEQVLTPEQFALNVEVQPNSGQRVEYAIRLPGSDDEPLWLPIDSKMPTADYERLVEASERGDAIAVEDATRSLERSILTCARDICGKYIHPPYSTDFGVMFLPTEGLFAEVVRRPGLIDQMQRECRVIVTGPTTLMALLSSLRMGFRSLAIQQRSSEVWQVLGSVKTEFAKFGGVLDKVHKKLGEAQNVVEDARKRGRAVDRKLRDVEALPEAVTRDVLALAIGDIAEVDTAEEANAA